MIDLSFYNDKKVFITGHTGFKGTWLAHILVMSGADVTGYALEPSTSPSLFLYTGIEKKIKSIIGDIRDRKFLIETINRDKPEIVFHLAAQPLVRLSYSEPALTYETNVMGTVNILEAVRLTPSVRSFVNITTDKVYENKEWLWGYRENENLCGFDPYSNSKSCSELITYSYKNSFFQTPYSTAISTARSGNVIGGGDFALDRIIPDCVRAVLEEREIIIRNPHSTRPYQHVLECLSGYLLLASKQFEDSSLAGSYNFAPDDSSCVTTEELVNIFCDAWDGATWKVQGDGGPHEANFLKLDCSKAKNALGWKPNWSVTKAIDSVVEFAKMQTDRDRASCLRRQISSYFELSGEL